MDKYEYPVCMACLDVVGVEHIFRSNPGPMDGPAPERQRQGIRFEVCYNCKTKSISGLYLKYPPDQIPKITVR